MLAMGFIPPGCSIVRDTSLRSDESAREIGTNSQCHRCAMNPSLARALVADCFAVSCANCQPTGYERSNHDSPELSTLQYFRRSSLPAFASCGCVDCHRLFSGKPPLHPPIALIELQPSGTASAIIGLQEAFSATDCAYNVPAVDMERQGDRHGRVVAPPRTEN